MFCNSFERTDMSSADDSEGAGTSYTSDKQRDIILRMEITVCFMVYKVSK